MSTTDKIQNVAIAFLFGWSVFSPFMPWNRRG